VRAVFDEVLPNLKPGSIFVDMTTSEPALAEAMYKEGLGWGQVSEVSLLQ
jgi:3-hydroxyisobutyrate dehydrogenase-like beta-hydroxyacid dehydrogenase